MQETLNYLKEKLKPNDTLVIGVSGGPDSMCLLHLLLTIEQKINIIVAHINHNIRQESDEEAEFVKNYCYENNVTYEYTKFPKKSEIDNYTEDELRQKRYNFYKEIIRKYHAKYLLTAHHGDDLIETILMKITRGSNLKGYSGFTLEQEQTDYELLRPLIYVDKQEIESYNKKNNVPYVIDKTNFQKEYTRNRYRLEILPHLKEEDKTIHKKYLKYSLELQKYYNHVDNEVNTFLSKNYTNTELNISKFSEIDELLQEKIIEKILNSIYRENLGNVNQKHIQMILDLIKNNKPNLKIYLPLSLTIIKEYNKLLFHQNYEDDNISYKKEIKDRTEIPTGIIERLKECDKKSNYYIKLNSNELKLPLYVRTRNNGDKMIIKNMESPKSLKDIFIDSKIPISKRNTFPIVVDANDNIIWLPGLKKSKFDKEKNENYDIILGYIEFVDKKGEEK